MKLPHVFRGLLLAITVLVFGACETVPAATPVGVINERVPLVMVPVCGYPTVLAAAVTSKSPRWMWCGEVGVSDGIRVEARAACAFLGRFRVRR